MAYRMISLTIQQSVILAKQALHPFEQALFEAEILLAFTLDQPRSYLHAWPEQCLSSAQMAQFMQYLERRARQEPLAYITGSKEFWSLSFLVDQHVLIPRPETELLVELTLSLLDQSKPQQIIDLGTGSGAIAIALATACPRWQIDATDIHPPAIALAKTNARQLGIHSIAFHVGNWFQALEGKTSTLSHQYDIIVSNPPYIGSAEWPTYATTLAFEPRQALVSGETGLDAIIHISQSAQSYLRHGGYLMLEHGASQGKAVRHLLSIMGYQEIRTFTDLAGHQRATIGRFFTCLT